MAEGDKYINASRMFLGKEQILRSLMREDANGRPFFGLNSGGSITYNTYLNPLNLNIETPKMDGIGLIPFGGKLRINCGWNPDGVFTPGPNTNKQWESNSGYNFTEITAAPFDERHIHACHSFNDNKICVIGGYGNSSTVLLDCWTYDTVNGWIETNSDFSSDLGTRAFFASCTNGNRIYIAGGQDDELGTTVFDDIWYTDDFGATFTYLCDLPVGINFSSGVIYYANGGLIIAGGSKYVSGSNVGDNLNTYFRPDSTGIWQDLGAMPTKMQGIFQNGCIWDNKLWYLCGSQLSVNIKGLFYLDLNNVGVGWTEFYDAPQARHAAGMCVFNNELHIVCGNFWNDSWCLQKEIAREDGYVSPLLQTWYNALSVKPSDELTTKLSVLMDGLDSDGVLDNTYLLAPVGFGLETDEQRLKPLVTTSGDDIVAVNSPTIASTGITGNGSTSYVNLKWNPAVDASSAQNDLSIATWVEDDIAENSVEMGGGNSGVNQNFTSRKFSDFKVYFSLNDNSNGFHSFDDTEPYYLQSVNRIAGNLRQSLNGYIVVEASSTSVAPANLDFFGCAYNADGTPALFSIKEQRLFFIGNGSVRMWQLRQRLKYLDL